MSIDITIEEMETLPAESYELLISVARLSAPMEFLPNSVGKLSRCTDGEPPEDKEKKIIICCSRGQISRDIAEELQDQGYEAYTEGRLCWMADGRYEEKGSR